MDYNTEDPYGLGLERTVNRLAEANPAWPQAFAEEAARLRRAFGAKAIAIEHIGSTSIPGLAAKPIVDILVGVRRLGAAVRFVGPLAAIGYDYAGPNVVPGHHIFGKGWARTHLVHIVEHGSEFWCAPIAFRDRLRAEPDLRQGYEVLKRRLVVEIPSDRAAYSAAKSDFINGAVAGVAADR